MSIKRLHRELREIGLNQELPYYLAPKNTHELSVWIAKVPGPKGTAYEGIVYEIEITVPMASYPFKAPSHVFITPIMHPNIENGKACLTLTRDWSPDKNLTDLVNEIVTLLRYPRWNERLIMVPENPVEFMKQAKLIK